MPDAAERSLIRTGLSRAHTFAKAADPAKLLLINKRRVKHNQYPAPPNRNPYLT